MTSKLHPSAIGRWDREKRVTVDVDNQRQNKPMVRGSAEAYVSAYREMQARDVDPGMPTALGFAQWFLGSPGKVRR